MIAALVHLIVSLGGGPQSYDLPMIAALVHFAELLHRQQHGYDLPMIAALVHSAPRQESLQSAMTCR